MQVHAGAFPWESDPNVTELAAELEHAECLRFYRASGVLYAVLPGFKRWQRPHKHEPDSRCPEPEQTMYVHSTDNVCALSTNVMPSPASDPLSSDPLSSSPLDPLTDPSDQFVRDDAKTHPPRPAKKRIKLKPPTGDPLTDYLLLTWSECLGDHGTLAKWIEKSSEAFPGVDLLASSRKASAWEEANPARRKRQVRSFLTRWWGREQDRGTPRSTSSNSDDEALAHAQSLRGGV